MTRFFNYIVWLVIAAPVVYLAAIWKKLPATVPLHYNMKGEVDRYGNKSEMFLVTGILLVVSIGMYLLLTNIHRIDPRKQHTGKNLPLMKRLAFVLVVFLSGLSLFIIYSVQNNFTQMKSGFILAALSLLFSFIGNYMYTLRPNYFAGIRLPWTLNNDDNWKKTHQLAGKLWFSGGIVLALFAVLLPGKAAFPVFFAGITILIILPVIYSYRLYRQRTTTTEKF